MASSCSIIGRTPGSVPPCQSSGGCGIRTREGLHPTRFPSLQTEVHAGSPGSCPAVWGACDTPANVDERGQLRPKLRPAGAALLPLASEPAACNLAQLSSLVPGPACAGTGSSRSDRSLAQFAHSATAIWCDSDRARITRAFDSCGLRPSPARRFDLAPGKRVVVIRRVVVVPDTWERHDRSP
jgi:hypothetical protein